MLSWGLSPGTNRTHRQRAGRRGPGTIGAVAAGGIVLAVVMLAVLPVAIMFAGAIWSFLSGLVLVDDAERHADRASSASE